MSKREITLRHTAIINKLKRSPATLKEINQHLINESELTGYELTVSDRTFQRDRQDILSLYNISIECDKSNNRYFIADTDDSALNNRMLEAFNTFNALSSSIGMSDYLEFESYSSTGTENFHGILHAVKNRLQLRIGYQSYWSDTEAERVVRPYFLKEFKNRWYLIAHDINKDAIRTFALDRIKSIEITRKKFNYPVNQQPRSYFKHCFGITAPDRSDPIEPIILSFNALQGKYAKSLPLHASQKILKDTDDGLVIQLNIHATFDFEMQILAYGENVEVLAPITLRNNIRDRIKRSLALYTDHNITEKVK